MNPVGAPEKSRIEALTAILQRQPENLLVRYMLANEYVKVDRFEEALQELRVYLAGSEDEGAGYRLLATSLIALGREAEAREAFQRGIEAATRHHHDSMVSEFTSALEELP
jgi:predicted Zn-dependent protease